MKILVTWILSALAIGISAWLIPGAEISGFGAALLAVLILGAVNAVIRPLLIILTLPINILTLGLFTLVVNAGMVALTAALLSGFSIANFWVAVLFSLVLSLVTWIMEGAIKDDVKK